MLATYRPSGRIGAVLLPVAVASAAVLIAVAQIYQLLVSLIPFMILNVLATIGFAIAAAVTVSFMVHAGRCRNVLVALVLAVAVAAPAIAASHFFQYQRVRAKAADAMTGPQREAFLAAFSFPEYVRVRVDQGWSVGRRGRTSSVSGAAVYVIWAVEALIVLGAAVTTAMGSSRSPFCEGCQRWASGSKRVMVRADQNDESLRRLEQAASVRDVLNAPAADTPGAFLVSHELATCPGCEESNYLTIRKVTLKKDRRGKVREKSSTILEDVHVSAADLQPINDAVRKHAGVDARGKRSSNDSHTAPDEPGSAV